MKILLFLFAFCLSFTCLSQDFEGVIEYDLTYSENKTGVSNEELQEMFGSKVTSYLKNGYYLETTDSEVMSYQLYRYKDQKMYYKDNINSDTLFYKDVNIKHDILLDYTLEKNVDTILGYSCDKLIIKDDYGIREYFYSSEIALDAKYYKDFTYINKNKIVAIMNSYYLRLKMSYNAFTVDIIATSIERKKLKNSRFDLPKDRIEIKSPN